MIKVILIIAACAAAFAFMLYFKRAAAQVRAENEEREMQKRLDRIERYKKDLPGLLMAFPDEYMRVASHCSAHLQDSAVRYNLDTASKLYGVASHNYRSNEIEWAASSYSEAMRHLGYAEEHGTRLTNLSEATGRLVKI